MVSANSVVGGGRNSLVKWGKFLVVAALVLSSGFFVQSAGATITSIVNVHPVSPAQVGGVFNITWTATGEPGDLVDIYYSTNDFATWTKLTVSAVPYNADSYSWDSVAARVPDGTNYKVKVKSATNDVNGISETAFMIDNTAPTTTAVVSPDVPNGENGWYKSAPTVTLSCLDALSGCGNTYYKWGGGSSYSVYSGPLTAPEGDNTLYYYSEDVAVDNAGRHNQETEKSLNIKLDTLPPVVSSYTLNDRMANVYFNPHNTSVRASITASESVHWTSVEIYNSGDPSIYKIFHPSVDGITTSVEWDGSTSGGVLLTDGVYNIKVHIKDVAGNPNVGDWLELTPYTITVDTKNPVIEGPTSPVSDTVYTTNPVLTFTATDPAPGTEIFCTYRIDSSSPVSVPCTGGTITGLSDGRHSVVVTATDQANNATNSSAISFVYDNDHTLTVDDTPEINPDFPTVQQAINAAIDGITKIDVATGTYNEDVVVNKPLTVQGEGASSTTIGKSVKVSSNPVTLTGFKIIPSLVSGEIAGVYLQGDLNSVEIKNNEIDGTGASSPARGVLTTTGNNFVDVSIKDNKIHNVVSGIYTNPHTGVIVIENNEIYNTTAGIGGLTGAEVRSNNFHDNDEDIGIDSTIAGSVYVVERNILLDNVNTYGGASVNVEKNWWGTAYKPTIQSRISGSVDFEPYYVDAAMTILSDTPVLTAYVDDDYTDGHADSHIYGYDAFAKIQEGIDNVQGGGSVRVLDGAYNESPVVNKAVTLSAEADAAVINGVAGQSGVSISAGNVTVNGFEITSPSGVYGIAETTPVTGTVISRNTIHDFPALGIALAAGSSNASVTDNELYDVYAGIYLSTGANNVTVSGNYVHDLAGGSNDQGAGVVFEGNNTDVSVSGNSLRNNAHGLFVWAAYGSNFTGTVVQRNQIIGNTLGATNTNQGNINASPNWWGSPTGPTHSSNPGGSGDVVSNNVTFSPWCTNEGCTEFGSSDPLHHFDIAASPNPAPVPGPITLTITAKDEAGVTRVNDNGQITLTANKPVSFVPDYLLNLVSGVKNADVSYSEAGIVNVHVTKGSVDSVKPITFSAVVVPLPTGVSVDDIVAQNTFATADGTYLHGWHYTFRVTVNNPAETNMFMRFNDWVNVANGEQKVTASPNTRLLINTSGGIVAGVGLTDSDIEHGFGTVKSYALGNNYSDQTLNGVPAVIDISAIDNSPGVPGKQVQFDVFIKLPESTAPGFYQTEYGIRSVPPAPPL